MFCAGPYRDRAERYVPCHREHLLADLKRVGGGGIKVTKGDLLTVLFALCSVLTITTTSIIRLSALLRVEAKWMELIYWLQNRIQRIGLLKPALAGKNSWMFMI